MYRLIAVISQVHRLTQPAEPADCSQS